MDESWLLAFVAFLPFIGFGLAVLYVGYVAYESRLARERLAREPAFDPRASVQELARLNEQLAAEARETRALLASTRETVRRGVEG